MQYWYLNNHTHIEQETWRCREDERIDVNNCPWERLLIRNTAGYEVAACSCCWRRIDMLRIAYMHRVIEKESNGVA